MHTHAHNSARYLARQPLGCLLLVIDGGTNICDESGRCLVTASAARDGSITGACRSEPGTIMHGVR